MELIEGAASLKNKALAGYCSEHELTVWGLILFQRKKALGSRGLNSWCDVESAIADAMLSEAYPVDELGYDYKSISGEIVFGIDGTGHLDDPAVARFAKTYRLLVLAQNDQVPPIVYSEAGGKGPVGIETGFIKFYGHSLASADYSYFQSIFDRVSLYSSRVRLLFFYGDYSAKARAETRQRVLNLLSAYGETMDNEDHGKNLIHKLILEGRLSIVRL